MATTEIAEQPNAWEGVGEVMATSPQRRALYRLGFARALVKKLTAAKADQLIKAGLEVQSVVRRKDE